MTPEERHGLAPIPQRIPPLSWRKPVLLWAPLAVAGGLAAPAGLLMFDGALFYFALIGGAMGFALALLSLGVAWMVRRPPRTRRTVVMHFIGACAVAAVLAAPAFAWLLSSLPDSQGNTRALGLPPELPFALAPLAILLALPAAMFAGSVFSLIAFFKPKPAAPMLELNEFVPDVYVLTDQPRDVKPMF